VPVPHAVADGGLEAELVVQPDLGDAVDVAQALGAFEVHRVAQAALEGGDDLALVQADAARAAHREDEGKTELRVVLRVELLDVRELLGRAVREAGLGLFVGGLGGERLGHHGLACEFRVGADQRKLRLPASLVEHGHHGVFERGQRGEGALGQRLFRDPGRVFVETVEHLRGFGQRRSVELFQGDGHGGGLRRHVQGASRGGWLSSGARCPGAARPRPCRVAGCGPGNAAAR
jgi:hypothetical protein